MNDFDKEQASLYLSEDDIIIDLLLYQMNDTAKQTFKKVELAGLVELHNKIGKAIRLYYRLDEEDNPYANHSSGSINFSNEVSMRIVERVWTRLTGKQVIRLPQENKDDLFWC